jgi:hypothetical protein
MIEVEFKEDSKDWFTCSFKKIPKFECSSITQKGAKLGLLKMLLCIVQIEIDDLVGTNAKINSAIEKAERAAFKGKIKLSLEKDDC